MCVCVQVLEPGDYAEWLEKRRDAEVTLEQREEGLFATAKAIEAQLELLGKTLECLCLHIQCIYIHYTYFCCQLSHGRSVFIAV